MAIVSVTIPWWIALVAGVVGAFAGTAVGIISTFWARSSAVKDRARELRAARRGVADELERLAAFLERCLSAVSRLMVSSNWREQATSCHLFSAGTGASPYLPRISDRTPGVPSPSPSPNGR